MVTIHKLIHSCGGLSLLSNGLELAHLMVAYVGRTGASPLAVDIRWQAG
jgi:hypothetical protein